MPSPYSDYRLREIKSTDQYRRPVYAAVGQDRADELRLRVVSRSYRQVARPHDIAATAEYYYQPQQGYTTLPVGIGRAAGWTQPRKSDYSIDGQITGRKRGFVVLLFFIIMVGTGHYAMRARGRGVESDSDDTLSAVSVEPARSRQQQLNTVLSYPTRDPRGRPRRKVRFGGRPRRRVGHRRPQNTKLEIVDDSLDRHELVHVPTVAMPVVAEEVVDAVGFDFLRRLVVGYVVEDIAPALLDEFLVRVAVESKPIFFAGEPNLDGVAAEGAVGAERRARYRLIRSAGRVFCGPQG
jgi:hypothetical protein